MGKVSLKRAAEGSGKLNLPLLAYVMNEVEMGGQSCVTQFTSGSQKTGRWQNQKRARLKTAQLRNWNPNNYSQNQNGGFRLDEQISQTPAKGLCGRMLWTR